jgi:feruloyl esterase
VNPRIAVVALVTLPLLTAWPRPSLAQHRCEDLAKLHLTHATITSATSYAAGAYKPPADPFLPPLSTALPAFCRVTGIATPTAGSAIQFEVWLPSSNWNGKFEQVGNGGLAGRIPLPSMAQPLLRGYATAATDDGHIGTSFADGSWAIGHPEKVIDYGYRAVHQTAIQAKAILHAFYGNGPSQSYFVGCSEGGREALIEAQRYPADFHGIVAGAPATYLVHLGVKQLWDARALRDNPASYIPPAKLAVLQNAAIAQCDQLDGVKDGLIENPQACHFDPASVECKSTDAADCLTAAQVEAAKKIYGPATNSRTGAQISPGFSPGAEAAPENWAVWITGAAAGQLPIGALIGNSFFTGLVFENPTWDYRTLNFDSDITLADNKLAKILNATDPDLRPFKALGGKLIQYQGWGDAAIPPQDSVDYFESVQTAIGPTADFYRLFMVPGMSHCAGGLGANVFGNGASVPNPDAAHDITMALDQWVTHDIAPDKIIATRFIDNDPTKAVLMTRPLCPYPQQAHYKGVGDTNSASSFTCQAPTTSAAP